MQCVQATSTRCKKGSRGGNTCCPRRARASHFDSFFFSSVGGETRDRPVHSVSPKPKGGKESEAFVVTLKVNGGVCAWTWIPWYFKVKETWREFEKGGDKHSSEPRGTHVLSKECHSQSLKQPEKGERKSKPGTSGPDLGVSSGPGAVSEV